LEVVGQRPGQRTFEVQQWRWIVERTSGWLGRYRRLSKGYEHTRRSGEAWIDIAMTHRMTRHSSPDKNAGDDLRRRPPKRPKP
jgi:putative transposase